MFTRVLFWLWLAAVLGFQAWMKWGPGRAAVAGTVWIWLALLCVMPVVLAVLAWRNRSRSPMSLDGLKCPRCGCEDLDPVPGAPWRGGDIGFPSAHCRQCGELVNLEGGRCGTAVSTALTWGVLAVLAAVVLGVAFYFTFINR